MGKNQMKIAILAPEFIPTWGGVGIYTVSLVKALSTYSNLDIHVITPKRGKDYNANTIEKTFQKRITIHNLSVANDTFIYNFKFQLALLRHFKELDDLYHFDIIHSMNLVHMPDILLKLFQNKKVLVTAHTSIQGQVGGFLKSNKNFFKMAPSEKGSILTYPIIALLQKIYLKKTIHMITVSNKFVTTFRNMGFTGRLVAIHNGIDETLFNKNVLPHSIGKKKGIKILFAGRLITQKGIGVFVKALSLLKNENIHFVVAGLGGVKQFKQLLKDYNIPSHKISFLGFIPNHELPSVYRACDIFVLPSYYENFPISLLEAMSCGCCCISTDVGAVDEIIENGINGFLLQPGDATLLSKKIKILALNKTLRKKMALQGYQKVHEHFTIQHMAAKTYKEYKIFQRMKR